jgi:hypothetical protein
LFNLSYIFFRVDFHPFEPLFAHEFSDSLRFWSEIKIKHPFVGDGEIEVELVWLELGILIISPLNQACEANTFYAIERNRPKQKPTLRYVGSLDVVQV